MERNCNVCNTLYQAEARYVNRGQGLTCSRACGVKLSASKRRVERSVNTQCAWCGLDFYRQDSHKNSSSGKYYCSKEHQSLGAAKGIHSVGPNSIRPRCLDCNKLVGRPSETTVRCLSCRRSHAIDSWLAGDNSVTLNRSRSANLPTDTKAFVKRYLVATRGDACEVCGWDEKSPDGRSIIQMDHINGNCFDNRLENLKLLCPNHHAMTPNYGSLNKGSGRAHRRKSV